MHSLVVNRDRRLANVFWWWRLLLHRRRTGRYPCQWHRWSECRSPSCLQRGWGRGTVRGCSSWHRRMYWDLCKWAKRRAQNSLPLSNSLLLPQPPSTPLPFSFSISPSLIFFSLPPSLPLSFSFSLPPSLIFFLPPFLPPSLIHSICTWSIYHKHTLTISLTHSLTHSLIHLFIIYLATHPQPQLLPLYSGKQMVRGDLTIFSLNRSFLFRNRIIEVVSNHRLLQIESNSFMLSFIRFCTARETGVK